MHEFPRSWIPHFEAGIRAHEIRTSPSQACGSVVFEAPGVHEDTLIHRCGDSMVALANSNFPFNCFFESETSTSNLMLAQVRVVLNADIHGVDSTGMDSPSQPMTVVEDSYQSTD